MKDIIVDKKVMNGKIIVVSITRIESDIIESFVRHALTFADELIIYDNASHDGTSAILQALQLEGLPIFVLREERNIEFNHAEIMTRLCFMAKKEGARLILPFDVDEFLINTENNIQVREILQRIPVGKVAVIPLIQYSLLEAYEGNEFLLKCKMRREKQNSPNYQFTPKCIVSSTLVEKDFSLTQGCHFVETKQGPLPAVRLPHLHLAHFHYRNEERYKIKSILGWLGIASKYSVNTPVCSYMKTNYRTIRNKLASQMIFQSPNKENEAVDLLDYCSSQEIKYATYINVSLIDIIMVEAERIAASYSEEKTVRCGKYVDILILFDGDNKRLEKTLQSINWQDYPYLKIWILCVTDMVPQKDNISREVTVLTFADEEQLKRSFASLKSSYTLCVLSGEILPERHIEKLLATVDFNGYNFRLCIPCLCFRDDDIFSDILQKKEQEIISCQSLWEKILVTGKLPLCSFANILLPSKLLSAMASLIYEFKREGWLDYVGVWRVLLLSKYGVFSNEQKIFAYADESIDMICRQVSANDRIHIQMKWFEWLNGDNEMLNSEMLDLALYNFFRKGKDILKNSEGDVILKDKYKELLRRII